MRTRKLKALLPVVAVLLVLWTLSNVGAGPQAASSQDQGEVRVTGLTSVLLQYQGRLTDPSTGNTVADGSYTMTFRLYDVATDGSALWTEGKDVAVQGGLFSTVLGDTVALDQGLFNGQELWLGVKVGTDAEATPRQRLLPVAYAVSLVPGAVIQADSAAAALLVANQGSGEAFHVAGRMTVAGDLAVIGSLTGGDHTHSGADITTGAVAEPYIDPALARDDELSTAIGAHTGDPDAHHIRYSDGEAWSAVLANDGTGSSLDADLLDGLESGAFASVGHGHSGADITSGTVAEARIDAAIARDSEIMPTVLANDGTGSGLDADLLDGLGAGAFASSVHVHDHGSLAGRDDDDHTQYFHLSQNENVYGRPNFVGGTSGSSAPFTVDSTYRVSNLNADYLDGYHSSSFATTSHTHDTRYYTQSTSESRYVNATGDTMSGALTLPRIDYTSPRTHYFSVGSEAFQPDSDVAYDNSGGNGGAYVNAAGFHSLVAPVHLPHGAVVTEFTVFFDDTSTDDMTVNLWGQFLWGGGYTQMAQVISSGTAGYYSKSDTTISSATIDNSPPSAYGYYIQAYSGAWSSSLKIKGAAITYTIDEAP